MPYIATMSPTSLLLLGGVVGMVWGFFLAGIVVARRGITGSVGDPCPYGQEDARTFMTNHALQVLYAPREQNGANE